MLKRYAPVVLVFQGMPAAAYPAATPPVAVQTAIADSGWAELQDPDTCKVARRFEGANGSLTIALQGRQLHVGPSILLIKEGNLPRMADKGSVVVSVLPNGSAETLQYGSGIDPASKRRYIETFGAKPLFTQLAGATSVRLTFGSREPIVLPIAGMDAAMRVLKTCQHREAVARGLDVAKLDAVVEPARQANDSAEPPISFQNYPPDAFRNRETGDVEMAWIIDTKGVARDCRIVKSSDSKNLDKATCLAVMKGPRYRPARDAAGQAVEMPMWGSVKWRLAGVPNR